MTLNASPEASSSLALRARAELERRRRGGQQLAGFHGWVPRLGSRYQAPRHLAPLVEALEQSLHQEVRRTAHAPPRHGKTDTVLAFLAYALLLQPHRTHGYITYAAELAKSKSAKARNWAISQGLNLASGSRRLNEWRTPEGGGLIAGGAGGPLTGQGIDGILVVDDPYKDRVQAESAAYKARIVDWWNDVAETRLEPGSSAFVFHTRWTNDDLIGRIHDGESASEWKHIHMPAISPEGLALWPERWPVAALEKKRKAVGEYTWASLFQGEPRARGTNVFGPVHYYEALPDRFRVGIGVDLAYSRRTAADYSIAVVMAVADGPDGEPIFFILDVVRVQLRAPEFAVRLAALAEAYPGAPMVWFAAGTELGSADFLIQAGLPLDVRPASEDKLLRAQHVAASWNAKRVFLPPRAPWAHDLIVEVRAFTGVRDQHDDQVDALAAAHAALVTASDGRLFGASLRRR